MPDRDLELAREQIWRRSEACGPTATEHQEDGGEGRSDSATQPRYDQSGTDNEKH